MAKPKLQITNTSKTVNTRIGASAASAKPSPLMPKKSYSKNKREELVSNANFGQTGLTGET